MIHLGLPGGPTSLRIPLKTAKNQELISGATILRVNKPQPKTD
jgi:hypothetical protein